jgi:hypothetical protein
VSIAALIPKIFAGFVGRLTAAGDRGLILMVSAVSLGLLTTLYLTNSNWFYTRPGFLDAWSHVGYGLYYSNQFFLDNYYKVSRLPWNLYQFLFRQLLLPIPAEIAIHFSLYIGGAVLAYIVCARMLGRPAGMVIAVFSSAFTLLHASGGADYQNAATGPLFFAVIATILWGLDREPRTFVFAGTVLAMLVHVNTIYVFFIPLFAILGAWLALAQCRDWRYILRASVWVCAGVVLCTIALILINLAFGRGWAFFLPQIRYAAEMAANSRPNPSWRPFATTWVHHAAYLGFIFGAAVVATFEVARILLQFIRFNKRPELTAGIIHALYLLQVAIWIYWQTLGRNTALQPAYIAFPLYGPMLLSIGAWLAPRMPQLRAISLIVMAVAFSALLYLCLINSSLIIGIASRVTTISPLWSATLIFALYLILLIVKNPTFALASTLLLLPISNALGVVAPRNYAPTACAVYKEVYDYIVRNSIILTRTVARPEQVYVWFDEGEPVETPGCAVKMTASAIGYSFASISSMGLSYVGRPFPLQPINEVAADRIQNIGKEKAVIVAVTNDETKAMSIASRFESERVPLRYDGRLLPPHGQHLVRFYVFRTTHSR